MNCIELRTFVTPKKVTTTNAKREEFEWKKWEKLSTNECEINCDKLGKSTAEHAPMGWVLYIFFLVLNV